MALKDWQKFSDWERVTKWRNIKTGEAIFIIWYEGYTGWHFSNYITIQPHDNLFKSKSAALKFAKSYMRTH